MSVLDRVVSTLNGSEGSILDLMTSIGLDPQAHLEGGDWRECNFRDLDLRGLSFRNCRLYRAQFDDADVAGADFTGADIHRSTLHKARNWQAAILDQRQYELLRKGASFSHDLPSLAARAAAGEILSVWQYVALMKTARNFDDAESLFDQMTAAGVKANGHVFATLMDKARDFDLARTLMSLAEAQGIAPDEAMVVALMSCAQSFEQAMEVFESYAPEGGFETTFPFNTLIGRAKNRDFAFALSVIEMMVERQVRPDHATINAALNTRWVPGTARFRQAASLVRAAVRWGVDLREEDLAALVRRAQSDADIEEALQLAASANIPRGVHIYNATISLAPSFVKAMEIIREMRSRAVTPDRHTFYALLTASRGDVDILESLAQMREFGLEFDAEVVRRAVRKASDGVRARQLAQQIELSGGGPAEIVRGLAIRWLAGANTRAWLDRLVPDLRPSKLTPQRRKRHHASAHRPRR